MPTPNFALPIYSGTDTAELDVLLNGQSSALDAALVANIWSFRGTAAQRVALTAPRRREGVLWEDSDGTKRVYRFDGTNWVPKDTGEVALVLATGWTGTLYYRVKNGYASLNGRISATGGTGGDTIATLPVEARPDGVERVVMVNDGANAIHTIVIQPGGSLMQFGRGTAARSDLRMASIGAWPVSAP